MIYLIRHGTTDQRILRPPGDLTPATRDEWTLDHGLSERGRAEAAALGEWLARLSRPDHILASPRRRTQETAALAAPNLTAVVDDRLHEWHHDEPELALYARAREVIKAGEDGVTWAFTHGGFVRAVIAALTVGDDAARFRATFHDFRRILHIWNASVSVVGHGASGLELLAVNLCPAIDQVVGRA